MIKGIHINSSTPFFLRKKGEEYAIDDFEVLTTILSALMWRLNNGTIKLYTDSRALAFYKELGITNIWDGGIDTDIVENIPASVNQEIFWAASKIFALKNEKVPVAMIDTDLIVWKELSEQLKDQKLAVLHREDLIDCYLPFELLKKREGYLPNPEWDWTARPCNTAFAYFSDMDFLDYYTSKAIDFMTDNTEYPSEMVSQMVFAEQRVLAMCAEAENINIHTLLSHPFDKDNTTVTHLWGAKDIARNDPSQKRVLCRMLIKKLKKEFPNFRPSTKKLQDLFEKYC